MYISYGVLTRGVTGLDVFCRRVIFDQRGEANLVDGCRVCNPCWPSAQHYSWVWKGSCLRSIGPRFCGLVLSTRKECAIPSTSITISTRSRFEILPSDTRRRQNGLHFRKGKPVDCVGFFTFLGIVTRLFKFGAKIRVAWETVRALACSVRRHGLFRG
jgi:hypothetical protein